MSLRAAQANEVARLKQVLQAEQAGFSLEQEADLKAQYVQAKKENCGRGPLRTRPVSFAKFKYARTLVNSSSREKLQLGASMLQELVYCGHEISSCLFALALAHYRLGAMKESRKFIEHLLRREPDNKDALVFHRLLRSEVSRDGRLGLLLVGGIALTAALVLRFVFKRRR